MSNVCVEDPTRMLRTRTRRYRGTHARRAQTIDSPTCLVGGLTRGLRMVLGGVDVDIAADTEFDPSEKLPQA